MTGLGTTLTAAGRPLLIPYVTGGVTPDWTDYLLACQEAGADAIEIGLPFSDPMLDGTTIQQASDRALARGATVAGILADIKAVTGRLTVPLIVMTYANLALRIGEQRLADAGVRGLIVPDMPLEESAPLEAATARAGIDLILLATPATPDDRLRQICRRSKGFVYAVSVMGTTGERDTLPATALDLVRRVKQHQAAEIEASAPTSTPEQPDAGPDAPAPVAGRPAADHVPVSVPPVAGQRSADGVAVCAPASAAGQLSADGVAVGAPATAASAGQLRADEVAAPAEVAGDHRVAGSAGVGLPVLIGFGVSTPAQAAEAGRAGDGVVVASALMRRVLDGATPDDLRTVVATLRAALDLGVSSATPYAEISGDRR